MAGNVWKYVIKFLVDAPNLLCITRSRNKTFSGCANQADSDCNLLHLAINAEDNR